MAKILGSLTQHPARVSLVWYMAVIAVGAGLLMLPAARHVDGQPITPLDAIFTSTSATCVTGLSVRSTGNDFSMFGQVVILALIQLGGIGIMTVTTYITFAIGGAQSLRHRAVLAETLGAGNEADLRYVLRSVVKFTLLIESVGGIVLFLRFLSDYSLGAAAWHAAFHCISAFCNAGFSLHDDSLVTYQGDPMVCGTIAALIICGGLGFPVMLDLARNARAPRKQRWERLTLHSKLMLVGSAALLLLGMTAFLLTEWDNALAGRTPPQRFLVAFFQSTTCRTAGFNTVEFGTLTNASLFVAILLMMIGAGPCSTGGGFKVTTFSILVLRGWMTFRGREQLTVARRTIPSELVNRAIASALLFTIVALVALASLLLAEQSEVPHPQSQGLFMDAAFEVISALATVGLSTGMTAHLSAAGRAIIILLMFMGRLGPITVFVALSRGERAQAIEYAKEEPLIG